MKGLLIKLLCFALSLSFILSATSCQQNNNGNDEESAEESVKTETWDDELISSDPEDVEYEYFFDSVEALQYAIKREPEKYDGATIKVVGTIYKSSDETLLVDFTGTSENLPSPESSPGQAFLTLYTIKSTAEYRIDILISSNAQYVVSETGDYVKIYGTLKMTRDVIYIDDCEYDLIATWDERIENINANK